MRYFLTSKNALCVCLAISAALVGTWHGASLAAEPVIAKFFSKSHWETMDWSKIEQSKFFSDYPWKIDKDREGDAYKIETEAMGKTADLVLLKPGSGKKSNYWRAMLTHYPALGEAIVTPKTKLTRSDCLQIEKELEGKFGQPKVKNDGSIVSSIAEGVRADYVSLQFEWELKKTRMHFQCVNFFEMTKTEENYFYFLTASPIEQSAPLTQKFAISCTQTYTFTGSTKENKMPNMLLEIDQYNNSVLTEKGVRITGTDDTKFTESSIDLHLDRTDKIIDIRISRVTGRFYGEIFDIKDGERSKYGEITGDCEKQSPARAKF